jgi:hypothetical protein
MKIKLKDIFSPIKIELTLSRPIYRYWFSKKYFEYKTFSWGDSQILIIKYVTKSFRGKLNLVTEFFVKETTWELIKTKIFYHLTQDKEHYKMLLNIEDNENSIYSYVEEIFRTKMEIDDEEIKNLNKINCIYKTRVEFFKSAINNLRKLQGKEPNYE